MCHEEPCITGLESDVDRGGWSWVRDAQPVPHPQQTLKAGAGAVGWGCQKLRSAGHLNGVAEVIERTKLHACFRARCEKKTK